MLSEYCRKHRARYMMNNRGPAHRWTVGYEESMFVHRSREVSRILSGIPVPSLESRVFPLSRVKITCISVLPETT